MSSTSSLGDVTLVLPRSWTPEVPSSGTLHAEEDEENNGTASPIIIMCYRVSISMNVRIVVPQLCLPLAPSGKTRW